MNEPITHVCYSSAGGAGVVARRLADLQVASGLTSRLMTERSAPLGIGDTFKDSVLVRSLIDNLVLLRTRENQFLSVLRDTRSSISSSSVPTGVLHLHWTPGIARMSEIVNIAQRMPVVWTQHDSWTLSGGCHLAKKCEELERQCRRCPDVWPIFRPLIANRRYAKELALGEMPVLRLVAPSRWVREQIIRSGVVSEDAVDVIPNPAPAAFFEAGVRRAFEENAPPRFLFVAQNINDPNKGLQRIVSNLSSAPVRSTARPFTLGVVGKGSQMYQHPWIQYLGEAATSEELAEIMSRHDVLLVDSKTETFSNVVCEAMATGMPAVAMRVGGIVDLITDQVDGWLVDDARDFRERLALLVGPSHNMRGVSEAARTSMQHKVHPSRVNRQYIEVYARALDDFAARREKHVSAPGDGRCLGETAAAKC